MEQPRSEGTNVHAEVHENGSTTTGNVGNPSVESGSVASPLRDGGESETLNHDRDESGQRAQSNDRNHSAHDLNGELPEFDWQEFEARYTAALKEADDAENKLVEQFDNLGQAFSIWVQASSQYESDRSMKRLKTRTRFVQLQEETLEQKKAHFNEVVHAFQKAMDLLKRR